jgi:hypothetical protein
MELRERFDLQVSISQINRVRTTLGISNHPKAASREKKDRKGKLFPTTRVAGGCRQAAGLESLKRIVVDREGMSAEFLAHLSREGRTLVTVLRTDQYAGLESFREVGEFAPLQVDRQGKVIREVALARFGLPLPEHQGQELEVRVALIRDLRRLVPKEPPSEEEDRPLR